MAFHQLCMYQIICNYLIFTSETDEQINIVIDADNLLFDLMKRFPLDYDLCTSVIQNIIKMMFLKLKLYKMNPLYFVFDGSVKPQKTNTVLGRREKRIDRSIEEYQRIKEGSSKSFNELPMSGKFVFMDCLRIYIKENNIDCKVIRAIGDGDLGTAQYAKDNNCYVLSTDSDFFLYNIKGLIWFNELDGFSSPAINSSMFFNDRYVYSPEIVSKCLNLPIGYFPLFGVLAGCDAITFTWERQELEIPILVDIINRCYGDIYSILKEIYSDIDEAELNKRVEDVKNSLYIYDATTTYEYPLDMYSTNEFDISKEEFKERFMQYMSIEKVKKIIMDYLDLNNSFPWSFLFNSQSVITPRLPNRNDIDNLSHFCFDLQRLAKDKYYGETRPYFRYRYMTDIYDVPARGDHMDLFTTLDILLYFTYKKDDKDILKDLCDVYNVTNIYENIDIHGNFPILLPLSLILYCRYNNNIRYDKKILHSLAYAHYMKHTHVRRLNLSCINNNIDLLAIKDEYCVIYSTVDSILGILGRFFTNLEPLCFSTFLYDYLDLSDGSIQFTDPEGMTPFNEWYSEVEHYMLENTYPWDYLEIPSPITHNAEHQGNTIIRDTNDPNQFTNIYRGSNRYQNRNQNNDNNDQHYSQINNTNVKYNNNRNNNNNNKNSNRYKTNNSGSKSNKNRSRNEKYDDTTLRNSGKKQHNNNKYHADNKNDQTTYQNTHYDDDDEYTHNSFDNKCIDNDNDDYEYNNNNYGSSKKAFRKRFKK
ncbi:hypothetical protein WA158_005140 [Blastocystis sp. Blastoise]